MRRLSLPIITLLIAAAAGATPVFGPDQNTVTLHDQTRDRTMTCACTYSNDGANATCERCALETTAVTPPRPLIRLVRRDSMNERFWNKVIAQSQDDASVRALLTDLEIQSDGSNFEFFFTCRRNSENRRYRPPDHSLPQLRDTLVLMIHNMAERECAETPHEITWAGCPIDKDRSVLQRFAPSSHIRISARPRSYPNAWARLRRDLLLDEFVYECSKELLIDPVDARSDRDGSVIFRANVTLICANDPARRAEIDDGMRGWERQAFRLFIRQEIKRVCGLKAAATANRSAR
ncbi:MAG: hypothetical protein Q7R80_03805 [bacterium]|nr:hypothetical protein [bacterium]